MAAIREVGATMRYVLVLLAASIGWTAPAFAESDSNCAGSTSTYPDLLKGCSAIIAPEPTPRAPSAAAPAPQSAPGAGFNRRKDLLGFHDIVLGNEPDPQLTRFIHEIRPDTIEAARDLAAIVIFATALAGTEEEISIEGLLKAGWQIAGYASTFDNRSTFILFRHADETYLVQCQAGYDVTRTPRIFSHCYKLH
jgi:hypothetical protein